MDELQATWRVQGSFDWPQAFISSSVVVAFSQGLFLKTQFYEEQEVATFEGFSLGPSALAKHP